MKIRSLVVPVFLVFSVSSLAADFWLEGQMVHNGNGKNGSQINSGVSGNPGDDSFGYYVFAQALSNGYRQIYGGPTWKPLSWFEVGVAFGRENVSDSARRNAYFSVRKGDFSAYGTFENGGSGPWHKVVLSYSVNDLIGIGVMDQAFLGRGPRVEYKIKEGVSLWGAVLYDNITRTTNSTLAVTLRF